MNTLNRMRRSLGQLVRFPKTMQNLVVDRHNRKCCIAAKDAVLFPCCRITNNQSRESITIGAGSRVLAKLETFGHGGRISIGRRCYIGEDTRIWSASSISIGDRVLISHMVNIHDTNAHSMSASRRAEHFDSIFSSGHPKSLPDVPTKPVVIGNDVWIGFGSTVLKGVSIGEGAVVGACSLVTKDVDPYSVVIGNPARVIQEIPHEQRR